MITHSTPDLPNVQALPAAIALPCGWERSCEGAVPVIAYNNFPYSFWIAPSYMFEDQPSPEADNEGELSTNGVTPRRHRVGASRTRGDLPCRTVRRGSGRLAAHQLRGRHRAGRDDRRDGRDGLGVKVWA